MNRYGFKSFDHWLSLVSVSIQYSVSVFSLNQSLNTEHCLLVVNFRPEHLVLDQRQSKDDQEQHNR